MTTKERFVNARKRRGGFTTVVNSMLDDCNLSLEAKGLLTILLSNDSTQWDLNMKDIIKRSLNGRDAHYMAINELILEGYFVRIYVQDSETNQFEELIYIFSDRKDQVLEQLEEEEKFLTRTGKKFSVENFPSEKFLSKKFPKKFSKRVQEKLKSLDFKVFSPVPEKPDMKIPPLPEKPDTEMPDTENQENKNTNREKTNLKNSKYVGKSSSDKVFSLYGEYFELTKYAKKQLIALLDEYSDTLVYEAIERTAEKQPRSIFKYMRGILKNWSSVGLKTKEEIVKAEQNYKNKKTTQQKRPTKDLPAAAPEIAAPEIAATVDMLKEMTDDELKKRQEQIKAKLEKMREQQKQKWANETNS